MRVVKSSVLTLLILILSISPVIAFEDFDSGKLIKQTKLDIDELRLELEDLEKQKRIATPLAYIHTGAKIAAVTGVLSVTLLKLSGPLLYNLEALVVGPALTIGSTVAMQTDAKNKHTEMYLETLQAGFFADEEIDHLEELLYDSEESSSVKDRLLAQVFVNKYIAKTVALSVKEELQKKNYVIDVEDGNVMDYMSRPQRIHNNLTLRVSATKFALSYKLALLETLLQYEEHIY